MFRNYFDFFALTGEVITDSIQDYINYKKAQITLRKYHKKAALCTSCGIVNQHELEALVIVSEHEKIQKNKKEMIARIKNQ